MGNFKIKYLKTTEEFVFSNGLRISDFGLVTMIERDNVSARELDLDDETFDYVRNLQKTCYISYRLLLLAKRQLHLRKLGRAETAWIEMSKRVGNNPWGRPKKTVVDAERLAYLKQNFDSIAHNCVSHDWFSEYLSLYHDVYPEMKKSDVIKKYKVEKNNMRAL